MDKIKNFDATTWALIAAILLFIAGAIAQAVDASAVANILGRCCF